MRIISPSATILKDNENIDLDIETRGRICYKSEDKITDESAPKFIGFAKEKRHQTVLEMRSITMTVEAKGDFISLNDLKAISPWIRVDMVRRSPKTGTITYIMTGSPRAYRESCELGQPWSHFLMHTLVEKHPLLFDDIDMSDRDNDAPFKATVVDVDNYKNDAVYQYHKHVCVLFIVNRAVSHELVRHRQHILQESQRYCKYLDDVTFIEPMFFEKDSEAYGLWEEAMKGTENIYLQLIAMKTEDGKNKYTAQAARTVLPNSCKTELVMDMNLARWRHFFTLRTSGGAEPSMREISIPLLADFRKTFPGQFDDLRVALVGQ